MKVIRYHLCTPVREDDITRELLFPVQLPWSEYNETIAKQEAHRGEYTIEEREEAMA